MEIVALVVAVAVALLLIPLLSWRLRKYRPDSKKARMTSIGFGELDVLFNQNRLHEHKQREHEAVMPVRHVDEGEPRTRIALDGGQARVHLD